MKPHPRQEEQDDLLRPCFRPPRMSGVSGVCRPYALLLDAAA